MIDMNYVDAAFYSNKLAEMCGIKNMRNIKQPEPRLLKDLGISEEDIVYFVRVIARKKVTYKDVSLHLL